MFFSNVSIAEKYNYLEEKFTCAYKWLAETDIQSLAVGSYPIMVTPWLPMSRNIPPSLQARVPLRHMRNILISSTWFQAGSSSACASATAWWKKSATRPAT